MTRFALIVPLALLGGCAAMSDTEFSSRTRSVPGGFIPVGEVRLASVNTANDDGIPAVFTRAYDRSEDLEVSRSIAQVQFDNWFAEEGADLVAANIRDAGLIGSAGLER